MLSAHPIHRQKKRRKKISSQNRGGRRMCWFLVSLGRCLFTFVLNKIYLPLYAKPVNVTKQATQQLNA